MNKLLEIQTAILKMLQMQLPALTDEQAGVVMALFPEWRSGINYEAGKRVLFGGSLYKCVQAHTSQDSWNPRDAASLWANVSEEAQEADGSLEHPFAWEPGMTSYNGKYYTEDGKTYLCTRDSGNPLYYNISALIGHYFNQV